MMVMSAPVIKQPCRTSTCAEVNRMDNVLPFGVLHAVSAGWCFTLVAFFAYTLYRETKP